MPPTDPTAALRTALADAILLVFPTSDGAGWDQYPHTRQWAENRADMLRAALAASQADDPRLTFHPVTGDSDFAQASLSDRLDTLADFYRSEGMRLALQADDPSGPDETWADRYAERSDVLLLVDAILDGTSYLPHREAAERVKTRYASPIIEAAIRAQGRG